MKNKSFIIQVVLFTLFTVLNTLVFAQEIQVHGKTYETEKNIILNKDAEFVKLKPKGSDISIGESYIKVNKKYNKTNFTASELKNFFNNGSLSSLGKVKNTKIATKPVKYIDKGSSIVIINYNKDAIGFIEIHNNNLILTVRNNFAKALDDNDPGGTTGDPLLDCGVDCLDKYIACGNSTSCQSAYGTCWSDCKNTYPSNKGLNLKISYYIIPLNKLVVKL